MEDHTGEFRKVTELPEFPENALGIIRGSIIRAIKPATNKIAIQIGTEITLGYDGEFIRCGPFTWSLGEIALEISQGIWEVTDKAIDLSDPEDKAEFARLIEHLELVNPPSN